MDGAVCTCGLWRSGHPMVAKATAPTSRTYASPSLRTVETDLTHEHFHLLVAGVPNRLSSFRAHRIPSRLAPKGRPEPMAAARSRLHPPHWLASVTPNELQSQALEPGHD